MTAICEQIIDHPSAWTKASIGGKAGFTHKLSPAHLDAIDQLLTKTRHLAPQEVTRAEFDHPLLNDFLAKMQHEIMDGCGVILISGITPDRYSAEDFQRVYWGFGTHLGNANVQSHRGDRLGYVRKAEVNTVNRGYLGDRELKFHTDSYELAGLMCVQGAASGGYSRLVSTLTIHNEILRTRPELLKPLYEGYYYAVAEAEFSENPVTTMKIPLYYFNEGKVSAMYSSSFMPRAAVKRGENLPTDLVEAIAYFEKIALRDDLFVEFLIEPGEMLIWHNYLNLHARTAFQNSDEKQRLLLRLWLTVPNGRPVDPLITARAGVYAQVYKETLEKQKLSA